MTRKDYVRIAAALREAREVVAYRGDPSPAAYSERHTAWALTVGEVARALQADNPRFDPDRFYAAAGWTA